MYHPGALNEQITINRFELTPDAIGGFSRDKVATISEWALIKPKGGKERDEYSQLNATRMYVFVIRYRDDLTEGDEIEWRGKEFNIRYIADKGPQSLYLEVEAESGK